MQFGGNFLSARFRSRLCEFNNTAAKVRSAKRIFFLTHARNGAVIVPSSNKKLLCGDGPRLAILDDKASECGNFCVSKADILHDP